MLDLAEPERSIIKLTSRERQELEQCEGEVASGLSEFLRVGKALSVIRNKRLFRETHASFDAYVKERWGLGVGGTESLITSYHVAEGLLESGIDLPNQVTQSAMRSLQRLPPLEGLRATVWRYGVSLCPGTSCPPIGLLQRLSKIIRAALDEGATDVDGAGNRVDEEEQESEESTEGRPTGNGGRKPVEKGASDQQFLRAVTRLSAYRGFSFPLIASQVTSDQMAAYAWKACERLKERLEQVEKAIVRQFPNAKAQRV
jgi:hypothetical protein